MTDFQNDRPDNQPAQSGANRGAPRSGAVKPPAKAGDAKTLLSTLRMTTAVGAVGLTLAGWGLLARATSMESVANAQSSVASFTGSASALAAAAQTTALTVTLPTTNAGVSSADAETDAEAEDDARTEDDEHEVAVSPTATSVRVATAAIVAPTATVAAAPTAVPVAVPTEAPRVQVNVVEWVTTRAGEPVAVVQDNAGVLWYVWGPDVKRIEQGLAPEYAPQAVNAVAQSRAS